MVSVRFSYNITKKLIGQSYIDAKDKPGYDGKNAGQEDSNMNNSVPRPEHPRPQWVRNDWMNLNGSWEFEMDHGRSGRERKLPDATALTGSILVPFCPESELSGVGNKDFMASVWYRRTFPLPEGWLDDRVLIHFGAVDYASEVWINGISAGHHRGGYSSFSHDITSLMKAGENTVTVCAEDNNRSGLQPRGKQSDKFHSSGCDYTRTTGIWQTVWLEHVPNTFLSGMKFFPDPVNGILNVEAAFNRPATGGTLTIRASIAGVRAGNSSVNIAGLHCRVSVKLSEIRLWAPGDPNLYDLDISLSGTTATGEKLGDEVTSYFGLRSVTWDGHAIQINGKPVFQRLVLDQGFWPDGVYTAASDEALRNDIEYSMGLGFNGARMHEKIFEARYLYWADKLGYMVWGEHASWGLDISTPMGLERFLPEWMESMARDFNSPALVGWCPFNETWDMDARGILDDAWDPRGKRQDNEVLRLVYLFSKAFDPTRPVIDTSGNYHVVTDIFDIHDYEQDVDKFTAKYEEMRVGGKMMPDGTMEKGGKVYNTFPIRQKYEGQPYFVSEYGGIWWNPAHAGIESWGYGDRPTSEASFLARYEGLTMALLGNPNICAFCYTQLTDVEQETNGLYTYERKPKFDPDIIRAINSRKAAIEG